MFSLPEHAARVRHGHEKHSRRRLPAGNFEGAKRHTFTRVYHPPTVDHESAIEVVLDVLDRDGKIFFHDPVVQNRRTKIAMLTTRGKTACKRWRILRGKVHRRVGARRSAASTTGDQTARQVDGRGTQTMTAWVAGDESAEE